MKAQQRPHYLQRVEPKESVRATTTPDGRYIPHSGGIMGWFENAGVPKAEQGNNYRFHTALDAEAVRSKLFARWSDGEEVNRRVSSRHEVTRTAPAALSWGPEAVPAEVKDYSAHGFRLQVLDLEALPLGKGDPVTVRILSRRDPGETVFEVAGRLMWIARGGQRRAVWSIGLMFDALPDTETKRLQEFFR